MGHAFSHHGDGADTAEAEVLKGRVASLEASEAEALAEWAALVACRPSFAAAASRPPQQHPSCSNRRETGERWSVSRRRRQRQQQPDGFLCPEALHRLRPLPSGTPSYTSRVRPGKESSRVVAVHERLPPPVHECEACGKAASHGMLACNMCGGRVLCEACSVPERHAANAPADLVSREESPQARLLVRLGGEEDKGLPSLPEVVVLYSSRGLNTAAAAELALVSPYVSGDGQAGEQRLLVTTADWVASSSSSAARAGGARGWASTFLRSEGAGTRHWEGFFKEGCGAGVASNCVVYLRRHLEGAAGWVRYDAVSDDGVRYCAQRVGGDGDGGGGGSSLWSLRHLPCGLLHPLRVAACPIVAVLLDGVADEAVASTTVAALRRVSALLAARGARVSLAAEAESSPRVRSLRGRLAAAGGARCASGGPTPLLVSLHYAGHGGDAGHFYVAGKTQARAPSAADVLRFLSQVADAEEGSSRGGGLTRRRLEACQYFNSDMGVLPDRPQLSPTRAAAAAAAEEAEAEEEEGGSPASVAWRRAERAVCVQCRVCGPGAVFACEADVREHELSEGHLRAARRLRSANNVAAAREAAEAAERRRAALVRRSVAAAGVAAAFLLTLRSFLSKRRPALSSARVLPLLLAALLAAVGAAVSSVRARK
eukprot:Rhum_TRINITY_DN14154_c6_g1::Rhum_TRINITY_DN14154_c6_g1_i1::g.70960::m.70960